MDSNTRLFQQKPGFAVATRLANSVLRASNEQLLELFKMPNPTNGQPTVDFTDLNLTTSIILSV